MTGLVLRKDGKYVLYGIQHFTFGDEWTTTSVEHILFGKMPFEEKNGAKGDLYREVLRNSRDAWDETGLNMTTNIEHAVPALVLCRVALPDMKFRLVAYEITQKTTVVDG